MIVRHPLVRALVAGVAVFAATTVTTLAVTAQLSDWQAAPRLDPLDPAPFTAPVPATPVPTTRTEESFVIGATTVKATVTAPHVGAEVGVVLVAGAGPSDRTALLPLADRIAGSGIAVLTYDKRTDGYSPVSRDYLRLADDASAAVTALRRSTGASRIGLLGISEGGWVASAVAARTDGAIDFVVLASAPVVSPLEQSSCILDTALHDAPPAMRRAAASAISLGRPVIDYLDFDPRPLLRRIVVPVFAVWGADDATVPVNEAYRRLRSALPAAPTAHIVAGAGHDLERLAGAWITTATAWMRSPSAPSLRGSEPTSSVGVSRPPTPNPLADLRLHVAASVAAAVLTAAAVRRRTENREITL